MWLAANVQKRMFPPVLRRTETLLRKNDLGCDFAPSIIEVSHSAYRFRPTTSEVTLWLFPFGEYYGLAC